jgi:hypothetical protein
MNLQPPFTITKITYFINGATSACMLLAVIQNILFLIFSEETISVQLALALNKITIVSLIIYKTTI